MKRALLKKETQAAVFAALICAATLAVQIPTPMTGGYVNVGDCFVLVSAWCLGPWYGFAAGGIGSMLADLLSGYAHYIPGTLLIKGLMATVAALLAGGFGKRPQTRAGRGSVRWRRNFSWYSVIFYMRGQFLGRRFLPR